MEENSLRRIMPHDREAEKAVISSMLIDNDCIADIADTLLSEDFYDKYYGMVYQSLIDIYKQKIKADLVLLSNELENKNVDERLRSKEALLQFAEYGANSYNVIHYVKIVKSKALLRKLIRINEDIANRCYTENDDVDAILNIAEKELLNIINKQVSGDFTEIKDIVSEVVTDIGEASKNKEYLTGVESGFIDLDAMTNGYQKSDLILVAARPSMGKTAFVLNTLHHLAVKKNLSCLFFSLEMSDKQLVNRMLSLGTGISGSKLKKGDLQIDEWKNLYTHAGQFNNAHIMIDDTPAATLNDIRSKCRKAKLKYGLDIVFIDYLQLMNYSGKKTDNRQQEISEISRGLKAVAREMSVPVIALSQLSRGPEQRKDHRPMLSDLRESGAIEQDADIVMFLYRDYYYNNETDNPNVAEVIIAKHRNGPTGTVYLNWDAETTRFYNLEKQYV